MTYDPDIRSFEPGDAQLFTAGYSTLRLYVLPGVLDINMYPLGLTPKMEFINMYAVSPSQELGSWTVAFFRL